MNLEIATLGGGCFWCLEAVYQRVKGVKKVVSGYSGGHVKNPSYREVCAKTTGHAEVIQIHFDPIEVSFAKILEVFWTIHDPTTPNRQGNDVGPQYRSAIFYHTEEQKEISLESIEQVANELWEDEVVTEISPLDVFYPAEDYHQNFYNQNTFHGYCQVVVKPKVIKFKERFTELMIND